MCLLYKLCTTSGLWLTSGRLAIEHKHTTQLMYVCMHVYEKMDEAYQLPHTGLGDGHFISCSFVPAPGDAEVPV